MEKENNWKWQLGSRLKSEEEIEEVINLSVSEREAIRSGKILPFAATPHFLSLIDKDNVECPLRKQVIPTMNELDIKDYESADSLGEDKHVVCPGLIKRYPDRVLLLITDLCFSSCRHCTRRRLIGTKSRVLNKRELNKIYSYLREHTEIRDVLISGGDPFILPDKRIEAVLQELRSIPSIEIIRFGTRGPVFIPQRFTEELCSMLKKYAPIYINIHFNHPNEISEETKVACNRLADSGIVLGSQSVLLKGVNDNPETFKKLCQELVKIRVRPYYIYVEDLACGTSHFRTTIDKGLEIIKGLRGKTSGICVPHLILDLPGGGGKISLDVERCVEENETGYVFTNYEGKKFAYPKIDKVNNIDKQVSQ